MKRYLIAGCVVVLVFAVYAAGVSEIVRVPHATGTYAAGSKTLEDAGLRVVAVDAAGRPREPHDLEIVVSQDPAAGTLRPFGSKVTLRSRVPRATVVVPDVVGRRVSDADRVLHDRGLVLDTGGVVTNDGVIAATFPPASKVVPFGTQVGYMLVPTH
jgi:beta-lactam-binding protein with PASTA domain